MKKKLLLIFLSIILLVTSACREKEYTVVKGMILSAGEGSILIQVTQGSTEDMMHILFTDETKYEKGIWGPFEKGDLITLTIGDDVMKSYPVQAFAIKIIKVE
jgi:hypothetical protein